MASIKSYSVAKTQRSYDPTTATPNSDVYAISQGRQGSYDHATKAGLLEGRTQTLVLGDRTAQAGVVTACTITTAGTSEVVSDTVVAQTTNATVTNDDAAGLIVKFTTNASGAVNGTVTIVDGGERYTTGDTVNVDGIKNSVLTITV